VVAPGKDGNYTDVTLGYFNIEGYLSDRMYLGCVVGPYANRIAKGRFTIDGMDYQLETNNGPNSLHSGKDAISAKIWKADQEGNVVTMVYEANDMEAGFPGKKTFTAIYTLTADNRLELRMKAVTDKKTFINLTNHAYFNLSGEGAGPVTDHIIQIFADEITPVDSTLIPSGEFMKVENTPFDFREPVRIGDGIDKTSNQQILFGKGYDHNWVLSGENDTVKLAVRLVDPVSKRTLELYTDLPGIQFYSGNFMDGSVTGKSGKAYNYRNALALEPQFFPDSPNHVNFPSTLLEPGKVFDHIIIYSFKIAE
jgi:aldose 1-epimerase